MIGMILVFDLLLDTPQMRKYQVTSDNSKGIITIKLLKQPLRKARLVVCLTLTLLKDSH